MNGIKKIVRGSRIEAPQSDRYYLKKGIVAFQLVEITFSFFGRVITETYDTKILKDNRQLIIGGDGFIKNDLDITYIK